MYNTCIIHVLQAVHVVLYREAYVNTCTCTVIIWCVCVCVCVYVCVLVNNYIMVHVFTVLIITENIPVT